MKLLVLVMALTSVSSTTNTFKMNSETKITFNKKTIQCQKKDSILPERIKRNRCFKTA